MIREERKLKRAKKMLPDIKVLITRRALEQRDKPREKLADELIKEIIKSYPKEKPPVLEYVMRLISAARNSHREEDEPWNLHTLDKYPISPDTVAKIFELKIMGLQHISIRDAQWFDRLSSIPLPLEVLFNCAQRISLYEVYNIISRTNYYDNKVEQQILTLLSNPEELKILEITSKSQIAHGGINTLELSDQVREAPKQKNKEESNE